ncbi:unnamed protein product [Wuchereria bancrofti]|uniref:Uncharacterized protein n=1 Tax=Wuchereria bancrofti TaxID=6293 RepID=A0A3P7GC77_WUCBA|nr:unnamed protein product [Wuchereria bancrofti]
MENVPVKSSATEMMETFQRSESLKSANEVNASSCCENAANEQKIPENGNVMNPVDRMVNVGRNNKASSVTDGHVDEKLRRAIDIVVGYSRVSSETKERLKSAVTDVHCKTMSEQEACQCYKLAVSYFRTYYNMVEKLLNRASLVKEHKRNMILAAEENGVEIEVKNEGTEVSNQTSNDESNEIEDNQTKDGRKTRKVRRTGKDFTRGISAIDKNRIDKCIHDYCGTSVRHSTKADAIRKAVGMMLHEGYTGVDAARATNLTPRTVMKHACVVRDALNLPKLRKSKQQTAHKDGTNEIKKGSLIEKVTDSDHEIARMLINKEFGCVEAKDVLETTLELESKIDKLLREFNYSGDVKKIREAIIKIFTEQNSSAMYKTITELPVTIISSYIRLFKGFLWLENMMKKTKDTVVALPRRGKRRLCGDREHNDVKSTKLVKSSDSDGIFSAKKKRKSITVMPRGVFIGKIDVMALHVENGVENEEQLIKSVISYLISHQYRRSETAQTNMQICLEHVLLDGLSVAETLKIHDGPNEGILEIYHKRCRDAFTALTVDFPTFSVALNLLNENEKNKSRKKPSRISSVKMEVIKSVVVGNVTNVDALKFDAVEKLLISIPEKAKTLLHNYIMKLLDINFPLEKRLISGLLQMIGRKMAVKYVLGDKLLEDCVAYFHEKHNNFVA